MKLKQALKKKLSKKELELVRSSFDIVGSIGIIEVDDKLKKKEKIIAETLLKLNPHIKTVLKKSGIHYGVYRRQKMIFLAGIKTKTAEHKESGIRMLIDVEKCFFSSRLSTERLRISKQIAPKEEILVMFSGVAPYPLVFARNSKAKVIYGIEKNHIAHEFAEKNVLLNKFWERIRLIRGDVRKIIPVMNKKFDRILMPMPKTAEEFLPIAFKAAKKGTIIHYYDFGKEEEFKILREKVNNACKKEKKKCRILRTVKCGNYSPGVFRVCIDFRIL
ncbi:class I SAM-dependent methyltransferase family protein [Candidatus Woesearchaeota archaeon]|nr:class I SAM-dependent methyltransferase family protein [Candidatus Woesearchaeota archaeon]